MRLGRFLCAGVTLGLCFPASIARGAEFIFTASDAVSQECVDGFAAAGRRWSAHIADDITIRIHIDFAALTTNTLAQTTAAQFIYPYASVRNALASAATSADDQRAVSNLSAGSSMKMLLNYTTSKRNPAGGATPYLDVEASSDPANNANNRSITLTQANIKALGLRLQQPDTYDATIVFNSNYTYDFNPLDGIKSGAFDFVGLATHELGHALGFMSGVDRLDAVAGSADPPAEGDMPYVSTLDLYRYSKESVAYGSGVIDWTADSRDKYFSLDGGTSAIAGFSTGSRKGDGNQASHWKNGLDLGVEDPSWPPGVILSMSELDRLAFDVIGYRLNTTFRWGGGAGGSWSNALNWEAACVPSQAIDVLFDRAAAYTVSLSAPAQARSMRIAGGAMTLNLGGHRLAIESDVSVGDAAELHAVGSGTMAARSMYVGGNAAAAGTGGTVSLGTGTRLEVADTLRIWNVPGAALNVAGGTVIAGTVINGGSFNLTEGTLSVSGSFVNEAGTAHIGGVQNWGPLSSLNANGGVVSLHSDGGSPAQAPLTVNANPGATVRFHASQHLNALHIRGAEAGVAEGGHHVIITKALSIDSAGRLDLADNALIVRSDSAGRNATLDQIISLVTTGRNGGTWDGSGIASSAAAGNGLAGLAAMLNDRGNGVALFERFAGEEVDANSILVKYTWNGDADLSGVIDADDYYRIDQGLLRGLDGYRNGDFNYDGKTDADDYCLIDAAYLGQNGALGLPAAWGLSLASTVGSVPEPGSMVGLIGIAAGLLGRRRPVTRRTLRGIRA